MKVSVVVPVYNSKDTLFDLLSSIRNSDPCDYEIIVVDDCSTDGSSAIASKFKVRVIILEKNAGPATARNKGFGVAEGEVVLFLDADVKMPPHLIAHVSERMEKEPELIAINGYYSQEPLNEGLFQKYKARYIHFSFQDKEDTEVLETCCAAVRKSALIKTGGFDTSYRGADVEDYELGYRLSQLGPMKIDHKMIVGHHSPGFIKNAINYFRRSSMWMQLYLKRLKFDSAATTASEGLSRGLGSVSMLFFFATFFNLSFFIPFSIILFVLYLCITRKFFLYLYNEEGLFFLLAGIIFHWINSIVIVSGIIDGLIRYALPHARKHA